jgi:hypothetical protein
LGEFDPVTVLQARAHCAACVHFRDDADFIEQALPGLSALSSARGSVRADDGICQRHDRFVSGRGGCGKFSAGQE